MENKQAIVFGLWDKDTLLGFRSDTFGTLSMKYPKIYHYSENQVNIVKNSTKSVLAKGSSMFFKKLFGMDTVPMNMQGEELSKDSILEQVSQNEEKLRSSKEIQLKVHPFIDYEGEWEYPEQWKIDAEIANLKEPIESYTFVVVDNEN